MGIEARWQMLLAQNFHHQVSGRQPRAATTGKPIASQIEAVALADR
jgi:hypothetical protein